MIDILKRFVYQHLRIRNPVYLFFCNYICYRSNALNLFTNPKIIESNEQR